MMELKTLENKHGKSSLRRFIKEFNESIGKYCSYVIYKPKFKIYSTTPKKSKYVVVDANKLKSELKNTIVKLTNTICGELEAMQKVALKKGCTPRIGKDIFIFEEDYTIFKMNWGIKESKLKCPKCGVNIKREKRWKCVKCGATYKK